MEWTVVTLVTGPNFYGSHPAEGVLRDHFNMGDSMPSRQFQRLDQTIHLEPSFQSQSSLNFPVGQPAFSQS